MASNGMVCPNGVSEPFASLKFPMKVRKFDDMGFGVNMLLRLLGPFREKKI